MQQISIDTSLSRASKLFKKGKASDALKIIMRIQAAFPENERARKMLYKLRSDDQLKALDPPNKLLQPIIADYERNEFQKSLRGAENLSKKFQNPQFSIVY